MSLLILLYKLNKFVYYFTLYIFQKRFSFFDKYIIAYVMYLDTYVYD